jgi:arginine:ornithine antiporter/lysine permease
MVIAVSNPIKPAIKVTPANPPPTSNSPLPTGGGGVTPHKLGLIALTLLVISAMLGGGMFNLPQNMAQSAGLKSVLIAWLISGLGIFFLARTFQVLSDVKPDLKSGIYMYSRSGFGKFAGFQIAWGYWLSAVFANVAYAVLLMDTLNYFFPPYFKGGNTWQAIILVSFVFWGMNAMVLHGVKRAAALNVVGAISNFVPIAIFIVAVALFMKAGMWQSAFWGNVSKSATAPAPLGSILEQVRSTMLVTLWVFIGIEGAVVVSDRADQKTVSRATILAFVIVTTIYVLVSVLPFGNMTQPELAKLAPPSVAAILGSLVGQWGVYVINIGLMIAVLSSWLVWTILLAELPWAGAKDGSYPKVFAKTNEHGAASVSLWVSTAIMQAIMLLVYFSHNAWNVMLSITGVMILPAYIGSTAYLWKLLATRQYPRTAKVGPAQALVVSVLGTVYGLWLVYAAGLDYMIAGAVLFAIGIFVFVWARREHDPHEFPFTRIELAVAIAIAALGIAAICMLLTGHLSTVYAA